MGKCMCMRRLGSTPFRRILFPARSGCTCDKSGLLNLKWNIYYKFFSRTQIQKFNMIILQFFEYIFHDFSQLLLVCLLITECLLKYLRSIRNLFVYFSYKNCGSICKTVQKILWVLLFWREGGVT